MTPLAYGGHLTKPSPTEQEEWRNITPYRLRGKATESLEQWAARFFATKVLMNGVTSCTSNMVLRRYLAGVAFIDPPLGNHLNKWLMDEPEAMCTPEVACNKVASLVSYKEVLPPRAISEPAAAAAAAAQSKPPVEHPRRAASSSRPAASHPPVNHLIHKPPELPALASSPQPTATPAPPPSAASARSPTATSATPCTPT
jgi:hypothetical protein